MYDDEKEFRLKHANITVNRIRGCELDVVLETLLGTPCFDEALEQIGKVRTELCKLQHILDDGAS